MFRPNPSKTAEFVNFTDGVCDVAHPGEAEPYLHVPFGFVMISATRYYNALNSDVHIKEVIQIPQQRCLQASSIVSIGENRYIVKEVQHKNYTLPKTTVLSLAED